MEVLPWAAPEALSRGHSPACPTSARAVANRAGSPVSARIAAAPVDGQPCDRGDQPGQPELIQDRAHPGLDIGEPGADIAPVAQRQVRAFQGAGAVRGDPGRVGQRGEYGPDDPQARPDPAPAGQLPMHRRGEPVQAQAPDPAQVPGAPDPAPRPATRTSSPTGTGSVTRPAPRARRSPADPGSGSPLPSRRSSAGRGAPPGDAAAPTPHQPAPAHNSAAHWPAGAISTASLGSDLSRVRSSPSRARQA